MNIEDLLKNEYVFMDHEKQALKEIINEFDNEIKLIKNEEDEAKYMVRLIERIERNLKELNVLISKTNKEKKQIKSIIQIYKVIIEHFKHLEYIKKRFNNNLNIKFNSEDKVKMRFEYMESFGFKFINKMHSEFLEKLANISNIMFGDYEIRENSSETRLYDDFIRFHNLEP